MTSPTDRALLAAQSRLACQHADAVRVQTRRLVADSVIRCARSRQALAAGRPDGRGSGAAGAPTGTPGTGPAATAERGAGGGAS